MSKLVPMSDLAGFYQPDKPSAGDVRVSSRAVARHFEMRHADLIRTIGACKASREFTERNFALSEYQDASGRKVKQYLITEKGFLFLGVGMTSERGHKLREKLIEMFYEARDRLRQLEIKYYRLQARMQSRIAAAETRRAEGQVGYSDYVCNSTYDMDGYTDSADLMDISKIIGG